ncbi:DUF4097 family beta strand repeat-containing protein [Streptomyces sp.]|uniref:DUF4097 family beta strand repeat-containing protein n=1 Tax=Streptomyces sp. TaxID=1931 RepID=UPI002F3EC4E0
MSGTSERTVTEPEKFVFDEHVDALNVRIVGGAVNVVGTDGGPARVEVTEIDGPPLKVRLCGSTLTVAYDDLPWKGFLKWWDRVGRRRHAVVSLAVPQRTRVEVGVVGAGAVISGISGPTSVQGVNGDTTLVGLTGPVRAHTVAGSVEAQSVSGDIEVNTVSGDLTVVEGSGSAVKADSVSGTMVLDLDPTAGADVRLTTVSGAIAIRVPDPGDAEVNANTTCGSVSCAFDELHVTSRWGARNISGRIGNGSTRLRASTVSGAIALLRRPPFEEAEGAADAPGPAGPVGPAGIPGPEGDAPSSRKDR